MQLTHVQENFMFLCLWDSKVNISETQLLLFKTDILKQNRFVAFTVQGGS